MQLITTPRYLKIAVDISARITSGELAVGELLKGRSVLSTEYNVSPETIRRAMSILSDKKVVAVRQGSGIYVLSRERALQFVHSFQEEDSALPALRAQLSGQMEKRRELDEEINALTLRLIDMYKYRRSDLISPVEVPIPDLSPLLGKSIGDMEVWHNTGATIIAIVRADQVIISPGPYYEFTKGDKVLIAGDAHVVERFSAFVSAPKV